MAESGETAPQIDQVQAEEEPQQQLVVPTEAAPPVDYGNGNEYANADQSAGTNYLRLRGLPFYGTDEDIRGFFENIQVKSITQVGNTRDGRPSGEAYVELFNSSDVEQAIETLNRKELKGRYIEIFNVSPDEYEHEKARGLFGDEGKVIRIRGLPWSATEEDIKAFFDGLEVEEVFITKTGGRPSGDAYLVFATSEVATAAMQFNKRTMGTRYIEVFHSTIADLNSEKGLTDKSIRPLMSIESRHASEDNSPFKIYMRGLPFDADARAIESFFSPLELVTIKIGYNEERRPSGDAIAIFGDTKNYSEALDRNRSLMGRRYVELFQADEKPPRMRDIMWKVVKGEGVGRPMRREGGGVSSGRGGGRYERIERGDYDDYVNEWSNRAVRGGRGGGGGGYDRPQRREQWTRPPAYEREEYGYGGAENGQYGYAADYDYSRGRSSGYGAPRGGRGGGPRSREVDYGSSADSYENYGYGGDTSRFREPHGAGSSRGGGGEWGGWTAAASHQPSSGGYGGSSGGYGQGGYGGSYDSWK